MTFKKQDRFNEIATAFLQKKNVVNATRNMYKIMYTLVPVCISGSIYMHS